MRRNTFQVVLDSVRGLTVQGGRVAVDGLRKFEKPWFYHDLEGPTYKARQLSVSFIYADLYKCPAGKLL